MSKETPIIFNADMVRAILEGRKTMTRRPIKDQPPKWAKHVNNFTFLNIDHKWVRSDLWQWCEGEKNPPKKLRRYPEDHGMRCPYGKIGDRLWVRETMYSDADDWWFPAQGDFDFPEDESGDYRQDVKEWMIRNRERLVVPSIHMPRWASRITLEITDVRVERVQGISEKDCESEGSEYQHWDTDVERRELFGFGIEKHNSKAISCDGHREAFKTLWYSIYPGSWERNDWVWVISFKVVEK